jgi:hypothetical protein
VPLSRTFSRARECDCQASVTAIRVIANRLQNGIESNRPLKMFEERIQGGANRRRLSTPIEDAIGGLSDHEADSHS